MTGSSRKQDPVKSPKDYAEIMSSKDKEKVTRLSSALEE